MKRLLFITLILSSTSLFATPKINKENCTITLDNGKEFKLYGRVQLVENFEDIRVEIVKNFADIRVETAVNFANRCGQWMFVENFPDIKIKIVESFPDVRVEYVESFPGIR